jgi:hypothetical protein
MVAAAATSAVTYPHMNGIGSDGFWIIHRRERLWSEFQPAARRPLWQRQRFMQITVISIRFRREVGVPRSQCPAQSADGRQPCRRPPITGACRFSSYRAMQSPIRTAVSL